MPLIGKSVFMFALKSMNRIKESFKVIVVLIFLASVLESSSSVTALKGGHRILNSNPQILKNVNPAVGLNVIREACKVLVHS